MENLLILFLAVWTYLGLATWITWHWRRELVAELWNVVIDMGMKVQCSRESHVDD